MPFHEARRFHRKLPLIKSPHPENAVHLQGEGYFFHFFHFVHFFLSLTPKYHSGSRYKKTAATIDVSGADTDARGTAPAIDHGTNGATTITEFSISIANF